MDFEKINTLLDILLKTKDLPNLLVINQEAMVELMKIVHEAEEEKEGAEPEPKPVQAGRF